MKNEITKEKAAYFFANQLKDEVECFDEVDLSIVADKRGFFTLHYYEKWDDESCFTPFSTNDVINPEPYKFDTLLDAYTILSNMTYLFDYELLHEDDSVSIYRATKNNIVKELH